MILDDENILIENVKNTIPLDIIKTLWNNGKVRDIEKLLNEKYVHDKTFQWKYIMWDGNFSYSRMTNLVNISIFLCDLDMDKEGKLKLCFDPISITRYFSKNKDKEEKFIQNVLDLFGGCMKKTCVSIYGDPLEDINEYYKHKNQIIYEY